jgi:hypothetical protein
MLGLPLAFATPFVLLALVGLPLLYYLLRVTPPPPKRVLLPTLPIVQDLVAEDRQPSRTPLWLLLLRLSLVALAILALAGPRWNPPDNAVAVGNGPLVILIDNGWAAAPDWSNRQERAIGLVESAGTRPVAVRGSSEDVIDILPVAPTAAIQRLRALQPVPHTVNRARQLSAVLGYASANPDSRIVWLSDATDVGPPDPAVREFVTTLGDRLTVLAAENSDVRGIHEVVSQSDSMIVRLLRPPGSHRSAIGVVRATDARGRLISESTFDFASGQSANAVIQAPQEARNDIVRLDIAGSRSAAAVMLLDAGSQRRKVALVSGESTDTAQPLVSGAYFVAKALNPYSTLVEVPRGGDSIRLALEGRPEVIALVDIGTLPKTAADQLADFVQNGGVVIRFAGSGLASSTDAVLPVKLRRGGRVLGGALSWEKPQLLAQFSDASPFAGLPVPVDIAIERQVLAEPEPELNEKTWASLADGTPLVTAQRQGKGVIVLFHVTADTSWSNLPLSGVFVDMLRKILSLAATHGENQDRGRELIAPRIVLDGFGAAGSPGAAARPISRSFTGAAVAEHPPGFYGPPEASIAVNTLTAGTVLSSIDFSGARTVALDVKPPLDLRPWLFAAAFVLLLFDALAVLWLSGMLVRRRLPQIAAIVLGMLCAAAPTPGEAQQRPGSDRPQPAETAKPPTKQDIEASLNARLAYVVTGNSQIDETSKAGLAAVSRAMANRTSFEPAPPVGLAPGKDELVFYSLIYWPVTVDQPLPDVAALRAIDQFMKNGGTVIFDTRDASGLRLGGNVPPESRRLREMLASIDVPEIEPIPRDHVLTKTFYLLERVVGRYAQGETWIEAMPRGTATAEKRPARAGDRVSPIIITSNDLAAAWAVDRSGQPMYPMVPGEPRQREMALRAGINIVMYAMTGNYKADQVHVPALLERLGQ